MKSKKEIEKMKDDIQIRIEKTQEKLSEAEGEFYIFSNDLMLEDFKLTTLAEL